MSCIVTEQTIHIIAIITGKNRNNKLLHLVVLTEVSSGFQNKVIRRFQKAKIIN